MSEGGKFIPPLWLINEYADQSYVRPLSSFWFREPRVPFPEIVLFPRLQRATDYAKDIRRRLGEAVDVFQHGLPEFE